MSIEWLQRTILGRAPFGIHVDDEYENGVDIRVATSRLVEPRDLEITLLVEETDGTYAVRIVAQYAPSQDAASKASYSYREEETIELQATDALMLQTQLSYLGSQPPIPPKRLPIGRPIEVSDIVPVHNSSFYFELVTRETTRHQEVEP